MNKPTQRGSTQILIIILGIILILSGFLYFRNISSKTPVQNSDKLVPPQAPKFLTYTNAKYGYSIQYPETLIIREFPDIGTGAGFRPTGTSDDPTNEVISINVLEKNAAMATDPLSDYAREAAAVEIQNYQKLNSIDEVKTDSGITGYKTKWWVMPLTASDSTVSGQLQVSLQITYFNLPTTKIPSTVQVSLGDENYNSDYNAMIKTFDLDGRLTKQ